MAKQKMTEERFNSLKLVIDALPKHKRGIEVVYESLGVSRATVNRIRRCDTWADYVALKKANNSYNPKPTTQTPATTNEELAERIDDLTQAVSSLTEILLEEVMKHETNQKTKTLFRR